MGDTCSAPSAHPSHLLFLLSPERLHGLGFPAASLRASVPSTHRETLSILILPSTATLRGGENGILFIYKRIANSAKLILNLIGHLRFFLLISCPCPLRGAWFSRPGIPGICACVFPSLPAMSGGWLAGRAALLESPLTGLSEETDGSFPLLLTDLVGLP